jgi:hypothetical protein
MDTTVNPLNIHITLAGIDQIRNGQSVSNPSDRREISRRLPLIADPRVAGFFSLLLLAVQSAR